MKRVIEGEVFYYRVLFLDDISTVQGHEGQRMEISLGEDDVTWERLSFPKHGPWQIHDKLRWKMEQ